MTIYERMLNLARKYPRDGGRPAIDATSLVFGKGQVYALFDRSIDWDYFEDYKILIEFEGGQIEPSTADGRETTDAPLPHIALGHHNGQIATAKAIVGQNFDMEAKK